MAKDRGLALALTSVSRLAAGHPKGHGLDTGENRRTLNRAGEPNHPHGHAGTSRHTARPDETAAPSSKNPET